MIKRIKIGAGSCGLAAGANDVLDLFKVNGEGHEIVEVGCIGHCYAEPLVEVETDNGSIFYGNVNPDPETVKKILALDEEIRFVPDESRTSKELLKVTKLAGRIDFVSIDEYEQNGGYSALKKALANEPAQIVEEVKKSGLRGRGGAGFPTGLKWSFLAAKEGDKKFLICNADEGDPGAFMDRSLMESVPHQVLEGMLIGIHATGSSEIFIYCRAEYPLALRNLRIAAKQIEEKGYDIINGRKIKITIKEGAGAFVCGEETAMINSLEGKRGTPRFRPPFPTDKGYKGYPSLINNVESFANIPVIINEGAEVYAKTGTEGSKGTKLFALAGDIKNPGLVEVPMGITIGEIVYGIGGAEPGTVKAVQIGGPSGGCIPEDNFDISVDYDSLKSLGAIMGSGGLIAVGKNRCMVETARYFLDFTAKESCGKCTFCRVGTKRMLETLEKITKGIGTMDDVKFLDDISVKIIKGSLCGLGQSAPNPVISTLRFFREDYREHVEEKKCSALQCDALVDINIDIEKCIKCKLCIKACPVNAINDQFVVDNTICTRCNSCIEVCPKDAAFRVPAGGAK